MSITNSISTSQHTTPEELSYEQEAVNWDKNIKYGKSRLKSIYTEWAFEVARRFSVEGTPQSLVCAHIKGRLRLNLCSEGTIGYVAECLGPGFKDPKHDGSDNRSYEKHGNPCLVYEDEDNKAMSLHYKTDYETLSLAEMQETIPRAIDLKKAKIKELRESITNAREVAQEHHVSIPEVDKISAPEPPEYFHGQSELYFSIEGAEEELTKVLNQMRDLKDRVYKFKPTKEVAKECADKLEQWKQAGFYKMRQVNMIFIKATQDILTPYTDLKWALNVSGWLEMADDINEKYGNKGAGTKHAIPTGEYVLKKYKDGTVDLVALDRFMSREQSGDKTRQQVVKIALTNVRHNELEQSFDTWCKKTHLMVEVP